MLIDLTKDLLDSRQPRLLALAGRLLDQSKGPFSASNRRLGIISSVGVGGLDVAVGSVAQFLEALLSYGGGSFVCLAGLDIWEKKERKS
jgi:hypothetical protein